jgi:hypothetical protein
VEEPSDVLGDSRLYATVALLTVVSGFLLLRRRFNPAWFGLPNRSVFPVPPIRSRNELVRAVDRFLIWSYGTAASFWNWRAAELALATSQPNRKTEIVQLADWYQRAKFGPATFSFTQQQLDDVSRILGQLAAHRNLQE